MNGILNNTKELVDNGMSMFLSYIKDGLHNPHVIITIVSIVVIGLIIEGMRNI